MWDCFTASFHHQQDSQIKNGAFTIQKQDSYISVTMAWGEGTGLWNIRYTTKLEVKNLKPYVPIDSLNMNEG